MTKNLLIVLMAAVSLLIFLSIATAIYLAAGHAIVWGLSVFGVTTYGTTKALAASAILFGLSILFSQ